MARIHEHQGKSLLAQAGLATPKGRVVDSPDEAAEVAKELLDNGAGGVVLKIQAWTTGRKALGGVAFADTPDDARRESQKLLGMKVGNFVVEQVLVEEKLAIRDELFVSLSIDDAARRPVMLLSLQGGSGIEDRATDVQRLHADVIHGLDHQRLRDIVAKSTVELTLHDEVISAIETVWNTAKKYEARSVEINPLVTTEDGRIVAADCRMTIDDYAVFRHPELGIEIARELDHPPTKLERIAYNVEQSDHRGTFYFAELPTEADKSIVGFHGAGGGGSMMSMDAVANAGFAIANFTDTSGNPSSAKVYRAARIILAQPGLVGYFGSGSGVASQEQFHSAYGLAKAFIEMDLAIPAVIRLGGNSEDRAVDILEDACRNLPAPVEGYKKDDTPAFCAERFRKLVDEAGCKPADMTRHVPTFVGKDDSYSFAINGGRVWINWPECAKDEETAALVLEHAQSVLQLNDEGLPELAIPVEEAAGKDTELIACEIECYRAKKPVVFVDLAIEDLD